MAGAGGRLNCCSPTNPRPPTSPGLASPRCLPRLSFHKCTWPCRLRAASLSARRGGQGGRRDRERGRLRGAPRAGTAARRSVFAAGRCVLFLVDVPAVADWRARLGQCICDGAVATPRSLARGAANVRAPAALAQRRRGIPARSCAAMDL
eukprot:7391895-Prymnesium_polylepis.2